MFICAVENWPTKGSSLFCWMVLQNVKITVKLLAASNFQQNALLLFVTMPAVLDQRNMGKLRFIFQIHLLFISACSGYLEEILLSIVCHVFKGMWQRMCFTYFFFTLGSSLA